jgi:hypothetical protein
MTKMHRIEDAARLAMAGNFDCDAPPVRSNSSYRSLLYIGQAVAMAAVVVIWFSI